MTIDIFYWYVFITTINTYIYIFFYNGLLFQFCHCTSLSTSRHTLLKVMLLHLKLVKCKVKITISCKDEGVDD